MRTTDGLCVWQIATMSLESLSGMKAPSECNPKELLAIRETYELACLEVSLKQQDVTAFERHMAQLKTIYTDYAGLIPKSDKQMELQGLSLLSLLAQSKIAEFHTELELIPVSVCLPTALPHILPLLCFLDAC